MLILNDAISDNNNNFGLNTQTKLVEIPFFWAFILVIIFMSLLPFHFEGEMHVQIDHTPVIQ